MPITHTSLDLVKHYGFERCMGGIVVFVSCLLDERLWGCLRSHATIPLAQRKEDSRLRAILYSTLYSILYTLYSTLLPCSRSSWSPCRRSPRWTRGASPYDRFPKFHREFLGRDPGTLKSDIVSTKTSSINLLGFETLEMKIRRLKLWKPTVARTGVQSVFIISNRKISN